MSLFSNKITKSKKTGTKDHWLNNSNIYIFEYILKLILGAGLVGTIVASLYKLGELILGKYSSFYNNINYDAQSLVEMSAAILVLAPIVYILQARTSGSELKNPKIADTQSHRVFKIIGLGIIAIFIVGMLIGGLKIILDLIAGTNSDSFKDTFFNSLLPGSLSLVVAIISFYIVSLTASKSLTRKSRNLSLLLLSLVSLFSFSSALLVGIIKAHSKNDYNGVCDYKSMSVGSCSYEEYQSQGYPSGNGIVD